MSRLRAFLAGHVRDIVYWIRKLWWVFVIVLPLFGFGLYLAVDHANANASRSQRHSNALTQSKFEQAIQAIDSRFSRALTVSIYSINKSACGFRALVKKPRQRAQAVLDDPNATPALKAAAKSTISDLAAFLETQVTVPSDFPCSTLPKNPPKAHS